VGAGVSGLAPGRKVVAVPLFGGHAEKVAVSAERVFPLPEGADLVEAAAFPVVFLTAWYLCSRAEISAGERVLVAAAAGGVRAALLQLRSRRRARAVALVGSAEKLDLCRRLGAEEAAVYADAGEAIERRFGGRVDVVADAIGGRVFRRLWRRLAPGGRYV